MVKTALAYLAAGRSVVPITPYGDAPSVWEPETGRRRLIRWERYQQVRATPADVRRWFAGPRPMGLGIVAGAVSGTTLPDGTRAGLECVVVHDAAVHRRFVGLLTAGGGRPLLARLPCVKTPTGGRRYGYLCVEWAASTVLARGDTGTRPGRGQTAILIDTRGEGDLCVVASTPGGVDPTAPAWGAVMVRGSWRRIPLITPEARRLLWVCARLLETSAAAPPVARRRGVRRLFPSPAPEDSQPGARSPRLGRVPEPNTDALLAATPSPMGGERQPLQQAWITFLWSWDWEWTCTLTFRYPVPVEVARKRFRLFESMLNRALYGRRWARKAQRGQGVGWVRIIEYQQRGVIHFHVLLTGVSGLRPRDWAAVWRKLAGNATVRQIWNWNMLGTLWYLTKTVPSGGEPEIGGVLSQLPRPLNS